MRIVTWNVNSLKARLDRVEHFLQKWEPDVLCLQETKLADGAFPALDFERWGYTSLHHGEGRWNGVAIISRVGLTDVRTGFVDEKPDYNEARLCWATCGGVRIGTVYVPNGREVGHEHFTYKLEFLDRLRTQLDAHESASAPTLLCGDFNIAPEDRDVYDMKKFVGATHVTADERQRLQALLDFGMVDTFRTLYDGSDQYTWWDYRGGDFHKRKGLRIDLILATPPLASTLSAMLMDREERKPTGNAAGGSPSDHAPLVADFDI